MTSLRPTYCTAYCYAIKSTPGLSFMDLDVAAEVNKFIDRFDVIAISRLNMSFQIVADKFCFASIDVKANLTGCFFYEMEKFGSFFHRIWKQGNWSSA